MTRRASRLLPALPALVALLVAGPSLAADREMDGDIDDWCHAVDASPHSADGALRLGCGRCDDPVETMACMDDGDCRTGYVCSGSQEELVWYDARTDGAVNDLLVVALAQDTFALYVLVGWHPPLHATAVPNFQIALDFQPGGTHELVDPLEAMVAPGVCSVSSDRACTEDPDCHFCTNSFEDPPCCDEGTCAPGEECRVRICGSGCDPDDPTDVCDTSQTCLNLGTTSLADVGLHSTPLTRADYLVTYDFYRSLVGIDGPAQLSRWTGEWTPLGTFEFGDSPGAPERPRPPAAETAITWDAFGCTAWTPEDGCGADPTPGGCGCPDFGPGAPYRFTTVVSRAGRFLDFSPGGAIEDVASEAVAGTTTRTPNSCPGPGIGTTTCELDDASTDTFGPDTALDPGGAVSGLRVVDKGTGPTPSITLRWNPSCSYGDSDYQVYEGSLSALPAYDHAPVSCSTAGETTATLDAGAGDRYFLVVPTDGTEEGSYGNGVSGAPRPQAATACRSQVLAPACG